MRPETKNYLNGIRIFEYGQGIATSYCSLTLAKLGAEVIKITHECSNENQYTTSLSKPLNQTYNEMTPVDLALNHSKKRIKVDLNKPDGLNTLRGILKDIDLVITDGSLSKHGTSFNELTKPNESIVSINIQPFRCGHAYSQYATSDLSLFHMSGNAHGILGPVLDPNTEPPIRAGGNQSEIVSGLTAATASMIAMYRKLQTGYGCHIVVSKFESLVTMAISGLANQAFGKLPPTRKLSDQKESSIGGMVSAIGGVLPCKDGFVAISPREDSQWSRWLELIGNPDWSTEERFTTRTSREQNIDELWKLLSDWSITKSKFDIARSGQEVRVPCFPVNTISDLLVDPHLKSREFFVPIDHPRAGSLLYPRNPFKINGQSPKFHLHPLQEIEKPY